ncbi:MAG TPA: hypothetical protein VEQ38_16610 [Verrucomicrobiae bacterium]|nr:hypothetical protein [Verrucomicrobiae bacterium]
MPHVLTTNAAIFCPHGGKGTTTPGVPKWQINGGYVAVEGDTGVLSCSFALLPCVGYQLRSMGLNATQIDGRKVILATDFNQSFTGLPLVMTEFHQTFDESTPVPIPTGQPPPQPTEEMADLSRPVVAPPLQTIPFSISTTPVPVVATFNLTAAHPLQWMLTLINTTLKYHLDLTNGAPGATVAPSGGQWNTPSLTVTVTMTPPFVQALAVGTHHLFLTGISRRGLSDYAKAIVEVSP